MSDAVQTQSNSKFKKRVFSGIQPSGGLTLGNYLGAVKRFVQLQNEEIETIYCMVDLHAITVWQDPEQLKNNTRQLAAFYIASGLNPEKSILFNQSAVSEHAELGWIFNCVARMGWMKRMTQFKDKSARREADFVSAGLFTYPALQAADIVLYDANEVPVGDDQRQHIEITRDIAIRFNNRFGETLVVPEAVTPKAGARVMDLQDPTSKMSKSGESDAGCVFLLDAPEAIDKKFRRAVTDSENEVRYDIASKPGVSNLLDILSAATGGDRERLAEEYSQYGPLKTDTAAAVIELLQPIQERHRDLMADPAELSRLLGLGAERARSVASDTLERVHRSIGLLAY